MASTLTFLGVLAAIIIGGYRLLLHVRKAGRTLPNDKKGYDLEAFLSKPPVPVPVEPKASRSLPLQDIRLMPPGHRARPRAAAPAVRKPDSAETTEMLNGIIYSSTSFGGDDSNVPLPPVSHDHSPVKHETHQPVNHDSSSSHDHSSSSHDVSHHDSGGFDSGGGGFDGGSHH